MSLSNNTTKCTQQSGWSRVHVGEMADLWLMVRDYYSTGWIHLQSSNRVDVFAFDCSSATFFLIDAFIFSVRGIVQNVFGEKAPQIRNQGKLCLSRGKILSPFEKGAEAHTLSQTLRVPQHARRERVHLCFASLRSLSLWPAQGMQNCLFESVVSSPRTVFIVLPEKYVCQLQSSHVLSVQQQQ